MKGVLVAVEIDAMTVRRGDQIMIGGQAFTVRDMTAIGLGRKRLEFASGETLVMGRTTVLWAARRVSPRLRRY
ncbi:hypothetical protein [Streptomyces marincola]|uniref:Uncharacterized protein n=1 Tax=Streptomyces marincola TaxID=2878388 RepID=A0A1W7CYB2_9ACTN|nr:hypothetical protein [Streptomyces marincola]ARQ69697.1 hypothetical protein CAG99_13215 [Streptomyces marincola]UCM89155.1 hypothetical protein LC193_15020 [Streptomyces marincola]